MARLRRSGRSGWALGIGLLWTLSTAAAPPDAVPTREVWVDAHARASATGVSGDEPEGSPARPLRTLQAALERAGAGPLQIHLRTGLYEGPFHLREGTSLEGHGEVVLHAPGVTDAVVTTEGAVTLSRLRIQGGRTGLAVTGGSLRAQTLQFSGHAEDGVSVAKGASLEADGLEVEGTISGTVGVRITGGAKGTLRNALFRAGLGEGLRVEEGGAAVVTNARSEGPAQAVRCIGCTLEVAGLVASGGRMAAVGAGRGSLKLSAITVFGHEYALLVGGDSEVRVRGLTSINADLAGVGLAGSTADLEDVVVVGAGAHGAINAVGTKLRLRRFFISRVRAYGLSLHGGDADVAHGVVRGVGDDGGGGDGVHARLGKVRLAHLHLSKLEGVGILAAQSAEVRALDVTVDDVGWAGLLAERGGRLQATSVSIRGSKRVAAAVPDEAWMSLDVVHAKDNALGILWAECAQGAELTVGRLYAQDDAGARTPSPCILRREPVTEPSSPAR